MTAHASVAFTWLILTLILRYGSAVQCFSCEGSGLNEVAANINCLEQGYLENCDDFYEYYTKVIKLNLVLDILITFLAYMCVQVPLPTSILFLLIAVFLLHGENAFCSVSN